MTWVDCLLWAFMGFVAGFIVGFLILGYYVMGGGGKHDR